MITSISPYLPRSRRSALVLAALAGTGLLLATPGSAVAAPDGGGVSIHEATEPNGGAADDLTFCVFAMSAFKFDTATAVDYVITSEPADPGESAEPDLVGTITLVDGTGHSPALTLPDGQYRLNYTIPGFDEAGPETVFVIDCTTADPATPDPESPDPATPDPEAPDPETP